MSHNCEAECFRVCKCCFLAWMRYVRVFLWANTLLYRALMVNSAPTSVQILRLLKVAQLAQFHDSTEDNSNCSLYS